MQPGDIVAERFEIERRAGSGGVGTVYRAHERATGQSVALKVLRLEDPLQGERFTREAEVLANLEHPGIVRYVAHGRTLGGELFLAMEWLEGESLAERIAREPIALPDCLTIALGVAEALSLAHSRGIVHRDLKPGNLFLVDFAPDKLKLLDFGVAHLIASSRDITRTGVIVGTPGYMAPEQARGERGVDARADVFALGCVLFRCITGADAFGAEDALAAMLKIVLEEAPRVSELRNDVPEAVEDLVARMLNKAPSDRPRDASAVAEELRALIGVHATRATRSNERPPGLTTSEWRLMCVLLARADKDADERTRKSDLLERLRPAVEAHGGRLEALADGSCLVTLTGAGAATDQAARAARCALAVSAVLVEAPVVVTAGRGVLSGRVPMGEVIDRAVELSAEARPGSIRLDQLVAGLLDVRFDVRADKNGFWLHGERELGEATRTLLGRPTTCVGREREQATLEALFDECRAEPVARVVLVTGIAGIGKSRVRYEFLRKVHLRRDAVEIWIGRGDPMSAGSPFGMIASPVREAAGVRRGEALEVRRMRLRARLARHVRPDDLARVSEFVGELAGVPFPDEDSVQLRAARQDGILMGDQMRLAWVDWLRAECAAQPVLLVLEDLHWGDLPSVKFVDEALRALRDMPFMVLALARPEVSDIFPRLWSEREVQEVRLGALTRKGSEKLVRQVLGDSAGPGTVERLVAQAAGNAFYLEELIRAVAEGKGDELPGTVLAMVQARLEALDLEVRRVLRAASVFGQVFWRAGVGALLGGGREVVLADWLRQLTDRELVTSRAEGRFPGEDEFVFRHALVREAAYAMLTADDKALGHRLAGEWLEAAGESEAILLAEHFERGGDPARAMVWYWRAAEQALGGNDFASVVERSERSVQCGEMARARAAENRSEAGFTDEMLGALRLLQAEALNWGGEQVEAERQALEAMRLSRRGSRAWFEALGEVAVASGKLGKDDQLVQLAEALFELPPEAGDGDTVGWGIRARVRAAVTLLLAGKQELANRLFDHVTAAPPSGDPVTRARVDEALGIRALFAGDPGTHLSRCAAAIRAFEQAGDSRHACVPRVNFGSACIEVGAYGEAEHALREALAASERMGLSTVAVAARANLALALARQDKLADARELASAAMNAAEVQGDRRVEAGVRAYLSMILLLSADFEAAEREARVAAELLPETLPLRAQVLGTLAEVEIARGAGGAALEAAEEAMRILAMAGGIEEGESLVRLAYAEALAFAGKREEANAAIVAARDRLLERASRIGDAAWKKSFLESVPENARTLALAGEWTRRPP